MPATHTVAALIQFPPMTSTHITAVAGGSAPAIGFFERYLTVWVALCIVGGILLRAGLPVTLFQAIGRMEVAHVNLPVGVLIWVMIIPMLVKIDFARDDAGQGATGAASASRCSSTGSSNRSRWRCSAGSSSATSSPPWLPADQLDSYIAGLILLAAAPCTAMVFVWTQLCKGDPYFTLSQVALNDAIMIVAFAPLVALLLGLSAITRAVGHADRPRSGCTSSFRSSSRNLLRRLLLAKGDAHFRRAVARLGPYSICALLADARAAVRLPGAGDRRASRW